jgi:hypothetical protein
MLSLSKHGCGKKIRHGVMWITSAAADRLYVEGTGTDGRAIKQERSRQMSRQTRLNLAALFVALPMVLIAITTTITNLP